MYNLILVSFVFAVGLVPVLTLIVLRDDHSRSHDTWSKTYVLYNVALDFFPSALFYASKSDDLLALVEQSVHKITQLPPSEYQQRDIQATEAMKAYLMVGFLPLYFIIY